MKIPLFKIGPWFTHEDPQPSSVLRCICWHKRRHVDGQSMKDPGLEGNEEGGGAVAGSSKGKGRSRRVMGQQGKGQ